MSFLDSDWEPNPDTEASRAWPPPSRELQMMERLDRKLTWVARGILINILLALAIIYIMP